MNVFKHHTEFIRTWIVCWLLIFSVWHSSSMSTGPAASVTLSIRSCWTPNFPPYPWEALGMFSNSFCFSLVCSVETVSRRWCMLHQRATRWGGDTFCRFSSVFKTKRRTNFLLYVLLVARACHRLGSPALLLLRHIILVFIKYSLMPKLSDSNEKHWRTEHQFLFNWSVKN